MKNLLGTIGLGLALGVGAGCAGGGGPAAAADGESVGASGVSGWLRWRGPGQDGASAETGLPERIEPGATGHLWSVDLTGRGTPVVAGERVYAWGYRGEGSALQEVLACLEAGTGRTIWERTFNDFLSDIIYSRYSIGAPSIDPETGRVYLLSTAGELACFTADGEELWRHSMMEEFGRMDFPNGRTGAPAIDGDLVIVNVISSNWGAEGAPRNRFYAFDKRSGDPVWSSTPGVGPPFLKDSSFATPYFAWDDEGRRVFYCGTGDGNIVCVNARTGEPIWRYQFAIGGVNSSVVLHGRKLIAVHGKENVDSTSIGRMIALDVTAEPASAEGEGAPQLGREAELWRIDGLEMFTSSPVLAEGRVYQVDAKGALHCIDAETGERLWRHKLGTSQLHASSLWADGKLYVPMEEGTLWVLRPTDEGPGVVQEVELEGSLIGSPSAWNGRMYQFSTEKLYCFGSAGAPGAGRAASREPRRRPSAGEAAQLQPIPSEVLLKPGESQGFWVRALDAKGFFVGLVDDANWSKYIPPTARVRSEMDASFNAMGELVAAEDAELSAGAFRAVSGGLSGTIRGRVLPDVPFGEDFESFELAETHPTEGVRFAYPPLPWIGARFKWDIREMDGDKVLTKTLDQVIQQRAVSFIGHPDARGYTVTADVMTGGNRRLMGEVGVINQRYMIVLKGNHQQLEVNSNHERLKVGVPFEVSPNTWYTLKARVDVGADGSGVVRAKAWERGEAEPAGWTIEVPHEHGHRRGAPGLFGFGPQNRVRVYIDNIRVTPSE